MKTSVENKIVLGFAASVLALVGIGWLSYRTTTNLVGAEDWVNHTYKVIATIESGRAILADAETAQRGYLLTGDQNFLTDSTNAQARVNGWLEKLRDSVSDNPRQLQRLAMLNDRIKLRQEQGLQAAINAVGTRKDKVLTDQIQQGISEMHDEEDKLAFERQQNVQTSAVIAEIVIVGGSAFACAAGLVAILFIRRDLRLRAQSEEKLRQSEEHYRTLFDSIDEGFCIIEMIFDDQQKPVDYRFLEINPSFEKQTGLHDALGKRMREIAPQHEAHWFEIYGRVAMTGEAVRFQDRAEQLHRTYDVYAFRFGEPKNRQVAILFNDITKAKEAEAEIFRSSQAVQAVNEQLRNANGELEAFSYSVSHDLRAPLRHVDGFVDLLKKQSAEKLDDRGRRYLDIIADSARRMGALIDDLLIFSRMSRTDLRHAKVASESLVHEVWDAQQEEIRGRHVVWKMDSLPQIEADSAMLRQVWANLIGNAVKYSRTRDPAEIQVGCTDSDNGEFVFFVRDNGVGFDMQYVDKLFGVFQRLHRSDEFEGTGIGLANVRRIISRHGGRTWAEGKVDGGATVFFSLPKTPTETKA